MSFDLVVQRAGVYGNPRQVSIGPCNPHDNIGFWFSACKGGHCRMLIPIRNGEPSRGMVRIEILWMTTQSILPHCTPKMRAAAGLQNVTFPVPVWSCSTSPSDIVSTIERKRSSFSRKACSAFLRSVTSANVTTTFEGCSSPDLKIGWALVEIHERMPLV